MKSLMEMGLPKRKRTEEVETGSGNEMKGCQSLIYFSSLRS